MQLNLFQLYYEKSDGTTMIVNSTTLSVFMLLVRTINVVTLSKAFSNTY